VWENDMQTHVDYCLEHGHYGWNVEHENTREILARSLPAYHAWKVNLERYEWEAPRELDPRENLTMHNQGSIGSCQGNALADAVEALHYLDKGERVELSRAWCYCGSQEYDGLLGRDSGSTLNGGGKLVHQRGVPLETVFPYQANYSAISSFYRANKASILASGEENLFFSDGEVPLANYEEVYQFLASQSGVVQIGIPWGVPDTWEVKSIRSSGGGHSVNLVGYLLVPSWPRPGILLKNSWGTNWGRGGYCLLHQDAVEQICRSRGNDVIGRSKGRTPKPKVFGE
jgi:C1A family cysteine protease